MSAGVGKSPFSKLETLSAPHIRPARFEDYDDIAHLASAHSLKTLPQDDWRSMWLDNPLWPRLGNDWQIGWVLETTTSEIVGSVLNVPSLYRFRGRELICGNGRSWATASEYRGYALWLMEEYFNQPGVDLFINTTVGPMAARLIDRLSARIPQGDWATGSTWVTGYVEFARQRLRLRHVPLADLLAYPAGGVLWLKHAIRKKPLPNFPRAVFVESAECFDSRFDAFWDELVRQNPDKLMGERNCRALSWHFAIPMRTSRLWILTASRNRQLRAYCILVRTGDGRQVDFVDYQTIEPDIDFLPGLLHAALRRCAKEGVYILRNLGRGVPKMRVLDDCAPYRNELSNWRFFYRAADPDLDAELRAARFWDPSVYDGDASFK
ncbi:MAG TPA: hypothetical protein VII69_12335 [Candidatus Eremiobacteraceae bacterium]